MPRPLLETYALPTDLRTRVEDELRDDEELLWLAQPQAKRAALKSLPLTLFAIPWTGFAVFWTHTPKRMVTSRQRPSASATSEMRTRRNA